MTTLLQQLQDKERQKGLLLTCRKFKIVKLQSFTILKIKTLNDGLLVLLWYRYRERAQKPVSQPMKVYDFQKKQS